MPDIHPVDRHVGQRVRLLRMARGLSQKDLADRVGVSFQQLQKYERGANRVSASKLYDLARALAAHPADFFDALPAAGDDAWTAEARRLTVLAQEPQAARLLTAFDRAPERVKGAVVELVERMVG